MRATGVTDYLKSNGTLEHTQNHGRALLPAHHQTRRPCNDETLDEYKKVRI